MKTRTLLALAAACTLVAGCDGLKEAFTAHVDVVAHAGSQELSVTRLGNLLGHATLQIPATREVADVLAGYWVDYQLLAEAAAKGDSLTGKKEIDEATKSYTAGMILRKMQGVIDSMLVKDQPTEAGYNQGLDDVYDARHILFQFPVGATQTQKDSVRKKALSVQPQVTDKNFADMARKYSSDGSAARGGNLGVFNKGQMVPAFGNAVAALKPGEISKPVESEFGYHIIQRLTYPEAKDEYTKQFAMIVGQGAERAYMAKLDSAANIKVKSGAVAESKVAVLDPSSHRNDNSVLATFNGGKLTVADFLLWIDQIPPSQRIAQQMQAAPDSIIEGFLKNLTTNQVILQKADSMHVTLSPDEQAQVYKDFAQVVSLSWNALGIDPKTLADSAKSEADREKLAASRVETMLDDVMAGKAQPVPIPTPLKTLLEAKYSWKINAAGLDRATSLAKQIRTSADSARAANQPKSQVPLPGGGAPPAGTTTGGPGPKKP
ncbi:MAG: peptidyl-prolyl cis-trans isomerase [Gemmatimonadota bacterium]|nr:peptidyl-prolyl cis-trans isomerase [Gemmatimonadota bacterium]